MSRLFAQILLILMSFGLLSSVSISAWAAAGPCDVDFGCFEAPLPGITEKTIGEFVQNHTGEALLYYINLLIKLITACIVIIGLIAIVVGGYIYMTAGGDGGRVEKAKTIIKGALLGIILALSSYMILDTISPQFASDIKEPTFGSP